MTDVIALHKADLAAGKKKMAGLVPQSNEWWEIKNKVDKYSIAYAQALNLAVDSVSRNVEGNVSEDFFTKVVSDYHLRFYKLLTEPYRIHKDQFRDGTKKSKEDKTIVNLDNEIDFGAEENLNQ